MITSERWEVAALLASLQRARVSAEVVKVWLEGEDHKCANGTRCQVLVVGSKDTWSEYVRLRVGGRMRKSATVVERDRGSFWPWFAS